MKILMSAVAVVSAPFIYGLFCVPLVGVLMSLQPELLNDMGGTHDVTLILKIEALQLLILLAIGFVVAFTAPVRPMLHIAISVVLMLAIGISVQVSYWDSMPAWHHFVFFASIIAALTAGGWAQIKLMPGPVAETL